MVDPKSGGGTKGLPITSDTILDAISGPRAPHHGRISYRASVWWCAPFVTSSAHRTSPGHKAILGGHGFAPQRGVSRRRLGRVVLFFKNAFLKKGMLSCAKNPFCSPPPLMLQAVLRIKNFFGSMGFFVRCWWAILHILVT